jgi:hypothetical protein
MEEPLFTARILSLGDGRVRHELQTLLLVQMSDVFAPSEHDIHSQQAVTIGRNPGLVTVIVAQAKSLLGKPLPSNKPSHSDDGRTSASCAFTSPSTCSYYTQQFLPATKQAWSIRSYSSSRNTEKGYDFREIAVTSDKGRERGRALR